MARPWGQGPPPANARPTGSSNSPASSSSGPPTSFRTNVNRQKTKRWLEAKSYTYDGDDWGEVDDFDEYHTQDPIQEEPPMPEPPQIKTTGLRQKGQAVGAAGGSPQTAGPALGAGLEKGYGDLQKEPFSASGGPSRVRGRANSFEADDERRTFSLGGGARPPPSMTDMQQDRNVSAPIHAQEPTARPVQLPVSRFSHMNPEQIRPGRDEPPKEAVGAPHLKLQTQIPGQPPHARPVQGSVPYPERARDVPPQSQPAAVPPPRKSADNGPTNVTSPVRHSSPGSASTAPASGYSSNYSQNTAGTAEQQSQRHYPPRKSSLSQDTNPMIGGPNSGPASPPGANAPGAPPKATTEAAVSEARGRSSSMSKPLPFIRPADIYKRVEEERERERSSMDSSRPSMDSVLGTRPNESDTSLRGGTSRDRRGSESSNWEGSRRSSLEGTDSEAGRRPKAVLDPVAERKSEYGLEHKISEAEANEISKTNEPGSKEPPKTGTSSLSPDSAHDPALQHQPSLGLRSAVTSAFDRKDDVSTPPTPATSKGSSSKQKGSGPDRSLSNSTTGISPILPGNGRGTAQDPYSQPLRGEQNDTPTIAEEPDSAADRRRVSATAFEKGRVGRPSSQESPAKTPELEQAKQLASPQDTVLTTGTPTDSNTEADSQASLSAGTVTSPVVDPAEDHSSRESDLVSPTHAGQVTSPLLVGDAESRARKSFLESHKMPSYSGKEGAELPASKDGTLAPNSGARTTSSTFEQGSLKPEQSFRPSLPGGWISYAPSASEGPTPVATPGERDRSELDSQSESAALREEQTPKTQLSGDNDFDPTPTTKRTSLQQSPPPQGEESEERRRERELFISPLSPRSRVSSPEVPAPAPVVTAPNVSGGTEAFPALSTDVSPEDQESDRLRKEIFRTLGPSEEGQEDARQAEENEPSIRGVKNEGSAKGDKMDTSRVRSASKTIFDARPSLIQQRFSWEDNVNQGEKKDVSGLGVVGTEQQQPQLEENDLTASAPPPHTQRAGEEISEGGLSTLPATQYNEKEISTASPESERPVEQTEGRQHASKPSDDAGRNGLILAAGEEEPAILASTGPEFGSSEPSDLQSERNKGIELEDNVESPGLERDYNEHAARVESTEDVTEGGASNEVSSPQQGGLPTTPFKPQALPQTPSFKQIMSMKTSTQRIDSFNQSRQQFAAMDSGLAAWLSVTIASTPDQTPTAAKNGKPGASIRGKPSIGGGQPYYQQYLNFSNATPAAPSSTAGPTPVATGLGQGGGGSSRAQLKGKEFVRNAGIFGERANSAAKGLLARAKKNRQ